MHARDLQTIKEVQALKIIETLVNTHNCLKLQISVSATYTRNDNSSCLALAVIRWFLNAWKINKQISVSATYTRNDNSSCLALAVIRWFFNAWKINEQRKKQQKQKLK